MIYHRQRNLDPGNCLQTCIACIMDLPVVAVPNQALRSSFEGYLGDLRPFLRSRKLWLCEVEPRHPLNIAALAYREYVMVGLMVGCLGGEAEEHCCVGRDGALIWDPYPTHPRLKRIDSLLLLKSTLVQ